MKRRSRAQGKMELLSLPNEILHNILRELCQSDFPGFIRAKSVCKGIQEVAESEEFLRDVDIVAMAATIPPDVAAAKLMKVCLDNGNASAIFAKGVSDFFKLGRLDEGLEGIHLAAERGYELAVYVYALLDQILHWEQTRRSHLTQPRKFFLKMEKEVLKLEDFRSPVFDKRPSIYDEKVGLFELRDLFYCCYSRDRPKIDSWKEPCDKCFMTERIVYFNNFLWKVRPWVTDEDLLAEKSVDGK